MIDRLRALLDRPLDPRHARAVVVIASCLTVTFALLVGLGVISGSLPTDHADRGPAGRHSPSAPPSPPSESLSPEEEPSPSMGSSSTPASPGADPSAGPIDRAPSTQDPQDDQRSRAGLDAAGENDSHRALQHLPYRRGPVSISLVGAERGKAVLRVTARTRRGARTAWRRFLRRFDDDGSAYRPVFRGRQEVRHG
jgi:hypothetical protein